MSAHGLPHLILWLLSEARLIAPLLSHHTVTGGRFVMLPAFARARRMMLIAHSPSSSPLYELAEVEYSEKDPASLDPVVISMIIQPAAQTLELRCLSYDPSVTATSVPARRDDVIHD